MIGDGKRERIAALDIGGTDIKGCLFVDGLMEEIAAAPTQAADGAEALLERAADILKQFGSFDAIGISTAGQVVPETGVIRYANDNFPGYTGTDVRGFFEQRFQVKTTVLNNVQAAALGEGRFGAGKMEKDFLCMIYGKGIGGALVLDRKLYYGRGPAVCIMPEGILTHPEEWVPWDAFSGTYEEAASVTALVRRGMAIAPELSSERVILGWREERKVQMLIDRWLDEVAAGLCTLIYAYNVPCVILGGSVMADSYAIAGVRERIKKKLIPEFRDVRILQADLGNKGGLYGAATSVRGIC